MTPVFLSYSRKDIEEVNTIAKTLMAGGIRVWQDIESLSAGASEEQIRKAICDGCFSLLFYATDHSVVSDFIREVEIKEAYKRVTQSKDFSIVPLFKIPIDETNKALKGVLPVDISIFNGAIFEADTGLLVASQKARKILLKNLINFHSDQYVPISLMTKQRTPGNVRVILDFDWFKLFASRKLFTQDTWNTFIRQALIDAKDGLIDAGLIDLRVVSKSHLSAGFAFGFVFRRVTGFKLNIQQGEQWWSNQDLPTDDLKINISTIPGRVNSKDLGIDVSISQDVQTGLNNFVSKYEVSFRAVIRFVPENGISQSAISSSSNAIALAKSISDNIRKANADYSTTDIHIFAAIPLGLAYLIGTELNACGRIHLYEFNNSTREYQPSWIIEGTE